MNVDFSVGTKDMREASGDYSHVYRCFYGGAKEDNGSDYIVRTFIVDNAILASLIGGIFSCKGFSM